MRMVRSMNTSSGVWKKIAFTSRAATRATIVPAYFISASSSLVHPIVARDPRRGRRGDKHLVGTGRGRSSSETGNSTGPTRDREGCLVTSTSRLDDERGRRQQL